MIIGRITFLMMLLLVGAPVLIVPMVAISMVRPAPGPTFFAGFIALVVGYCAYHARNQAGWIIPTGKRAEFTLTLLLIIFLTAGLSILSYHPYTTMFLVGFLLPVGMKMAQFVHQPQKVLKQRPDWDWEIHDWKKG